MRQARTSHPPTAASPGGPPNNLTFLSRALAPAWPVSPEVPYLPCHEHHGTRKRDGWEPIPEQHTAKAHHTSVHFHGVRHRPILLVRLPSAGENILLTLGRRVGAKEQRRTVNKIGHRVKIARSDRRASPQPQDNVHLHHPPGVNGIHNDNFTRVLENLLHPRHPADEGVFLGPGFRHRDGRGTCQLPRRRSYIINRGRQGGNGRSTSDEQHARQNERRKHASRIP